MGVVEARAFQVRVRHSSSSWFIAFENVDVSVALFPASIGISVTDVDARFLKVSQVLMFRSLTVITSMRKSFSKFLKFLKF